MRTVKSFRPVFALAALALLLITTTTVVLAQGDTRADIELVGTVDAITGDTLTVNGLTVNIATAAFQTPLAPGALVKIEGSLQAGGAVVAREVYAARAGLQPGEVELEGVLQVLSPAAAQVSGMVVDLTRAEIKPGLEVGMRVEVEARLTAEGVWLAREIEPADRDENDGFDDRRDEDFDIIGTLESINPDNTLIIGGQVIDISGAEIEDRLVVGGLVKAEVRNANGVLVASEVERSRTFLREDDDRDDDDFDDRDDDSVYDDDDNTSYNGSNNTGECVTSVPAGWATYTVRRGDTLSAIAGRTGGTLRQLAAVNCLTNARFIQIGQELAVPRLPVFGDDDNPNAHDGDDDVYDDDAYDDDDVYDDDDSYDDSDDDEHDQDDHDDDDDWDDDDDDDDD